MLFNSGQFFFFFIAVYLLYVKLPHRGQNILLLLASYIFYGAWDVRFLILIFISTVVDYSAGILIHEKQEANDIRASKRWMILSVVVNLGILGFFKYFNFFTESFADFINLFGWQVSSPVLQIILPAGISFYTFQTMSYSLDIYRGQLKPTRHFFDFALFVSFFPQLMAGPIERAKRLLPQIQKNRIISASNVTEGAWLILWGLFKKVYIADNLAPYAYWSTTLANGDTAGDLYLSGMAFVLQFYCDFSGYSDMARGLASMMGFKLSVNFNLPYFATNPSVFWQKWHITLSSWLRDYLYGPLLRSRLIDGNKTIALILTMAIAGFWHGADWRFILWGTLWGFTIYIYRLMIPYITKYKRRSQTTANILGVLGAITTLHLWMIVGQFFITPAVPVGFRSIMIILFDGSISSHTIIDLKTILFYAWPLILMQIAQFYTKNLNVIFSWPYPVRITIYGILLFLLMTRGAEGGAEFIYFQF
ncbi:MAG: MBOAT family protein [Candidatus Marinimicrobia bacterium]|nr:MBOAT family protein [Candidatus Neomarinimicrobiota bacterium]